MRLTIDIPAGIARELEAECGDLAQAAKEALAIAAYRHERLSLGQVAEIMGLSVHEANELLFRHGVPSSYSRADFERERAALRERLGG